PSHPLATGGVPAFAADVINAEFVGMDVTAPQNIEDIASLNGLNLLAGDFKGEDFSTLYAIDFRSYNLYKVDTTTGATTLVYLTVPPPGVGWDWWTGMAGDRTTTTMSAVPSGGRTPVSTLVTVNLDTAETTLVGPITGVDDPAVGTVVIDIAV